MDGDGFDPDESAVSREALLREVKDLRTRLNALNNRTSQLDALVSNVPGMVYRCQNLPDYPMIFLNGRVQDLTGYSLKDLLDRGGSICYGDIIHPQDQKKVWAGVQGGIEGQSDFEFEYRIITARGDERWVWERGRLIGLDPDGIELLEGLIVDITQRKKAETDLRESRDFIHTILENLPIGLGVNTMDEGKVLYVNPEFSRIYGWPPEDLQSVDDFFQNAYPDPHHRRAVRERILSDMGSGDPKRMRWEGMEVTRKDGHKRRVTAANIPIPQQNLMISTAWDTTALYGAQKELREKVDLLRELTLHLESVREEEKLSIAREIHDVIGQSLTAVYLDLEVMEEVLDREDRESLLTKLQEAKDFIQEILTNSRNLATDLRPDMLDLLGLQPTLEYYLPRAAKRAGLKWDFSCDIREEDLNQEISLTVYRLIQEAVTNSIRHAEASGIRVSLESPQGTLLVTVADDGRGITREEAGNPHAWGLVGMRERLLGLGGILEIRGVPGEGTTLRMAIPLKGALQSPRA